MTTKGFRDVYAIGRGNRIEAFNLWFHRPKPLVERRHTFEVNERTENIGARRLHTVMERLLEEISFDADSKAGQTVLIDAALVDARLADVARRDDLARYIL